jgi:hypothetical protein
MRTIKIILIVGFSYCFAEMAFSIQPSSKKMPEAITAKDLEGKIDFSLTLGDVLEKFFKECEWEGDIVDVKICENRRDEFRKEIVGKLIYFRKEIVGKLIYYEGGEECGGERFSLLAMTDYDVQKHVITFTIFYPVIEQGGYYFLTYDPSRILTLKCPPEITPLPFKTFSKKVQSDEEASQWKEEGAFQVEYIIKVKKPFKLRKPPQRHVSNLRGVRYVYYDVEHNYKGLLGDIVSYRVSEVKVKGIEEEGERQEKKEVLLSYPGEDWWKVIDEMKEREEMKKEQKEEGE